MLEFSGTKKMIFEAAVVLFSERGVEETSMRDITYAVGIMPSSFYNHFESKDELVGEMFRYFDDFCHTHWPALDEEDEAGLEVPLSYPDKVDNLLHRIINIAMVRSRSDPRAMELVQKYIFDCPRRQCRALLREMGAGDKLDEEQLELVVEMYTCICHSASMRQVSDNPVSDALWRKMITTLFSAVQTYV